MPSPGPSAADRLRAWYRRVRALMRRATAEEEMRRELAFHLDMTIDKHVRAGLTPAEARRAARLEFGGTERFAEEVREVRNIGWLEDVLQDLRHAARGFRRSPGFTIAAVTALSLGIGVNTALFPVIHGVIIAPLPYEEPDRIVRLWESNPAQKLEKGAVSPGTFIDLRERSRTLERIALFGERDMLITDGIENWESRIAAVSPAMFEILGVQPIVGRAFPPDDVPDAGKISHDEVVISHRLWQRLGGTADVIGRTLRLDYRWSYTVVGVMPPGFSFPSDADLWTPLSYGRAVSTAERQFRYYSAIARVSEGRTVAQASDEVAAIAAQLEVEFPASNAGWTVTLMPLEASIVGNTRPTLLVLLGLAGCVLLIACGNVATLALARSTARRHETAVRMALGAGKRRLIRQGIAEGLLLAVLGGIGGLVVGYWSNRLLLALAPDDIPRLGEVVFGRIVMGFAAAITLLTALIVGLTPALRTSWSGVINAMRIRTEGMETASARAREWLLGGQVALTFVIVVAAVLLLRSFERLHSTDLGYRRHDVLAAELRMPGGRFGPRPWAQRLHHYDGMMAELRRLPGVQSVAGTTNVPLTGEFGSGSMWRTDAPGAHGRQPPTSAADQWKAAIQIVTPDYFETLGIPVLRGRAFDDADRFGADLLEGQAETKPPGVAVINEAMARKFWPDGNPVGASIFVFDDKAFAAFRTIVGIVRDVRAEAIAAEPAPTVYLPFAQHPGRALSLVVRTSRPANQLVPDVRERLRAFDPELSIAGVRPLEAVIGSSLSRPRFTLLLVGTFALLAVGIAFVGVVGIVGFLVTRRTQEIGIRMALGAHSGRVLWLVLGEGLRPVLLGVVIGSIGAIAVTRSMQALLYGVEPLDLLSFASAAALLLTASVVAAALPARRATGLDPLRALRAE